MHLLPLFLDLRGKRVLLVGGGPAARAKAQALAPTGCRLRAVSIAFTPSFRQELEAGGTEVQVRPFLPGDLDGVHLAVSATGDSSANATISALARERGIWVNAVDDPAACDALFASVLRRGPFVAAISTEGAFAGLSRVLREAMEGLVPVAAVPEFEALAALRRDLKRRLPDPEHRARILRSLLEQLQQDILPAEARP